MVDVTRGRFELRKFADRKPEYYKGLAEILALGYPPQDLIHQFPAFVGHQTIARAITLYEAYKMTLGLAGHIAEVGVYKGFGSLLFAKLMRLFEPEALTLVHGFDWFRGSRVTAEEPFVSEGEDCESYERLTRLIEIQGLDRTVYVHNLDVANDLGTFFDENPHLQFKLLFLDCGTYDVVSSSIRHFWPRLANGGMLVLDHFNHEVAPGETRAVKELLPNEVVKTFSFGWMPNAYIVKGGRSRRESD